jgi:predicted transcriptional regulator
MTKKLQLTKHQVELLEDEVSDYIINSDIDDAMENAVFKNGKYHITIKDDALEDLIGSACFVFNHEKKNKNLVSELDILIDYLESVLEK